MPTKKNWLGNQQNYDTNNGEYESGPKGAIPSNVVNSEFGKLDESDSTEGKNLPTIDEEIKETKEKGGKKVSSSVTHVSDPKTFAETKKQVDNFFGVLEGDDSKTLTDIATQFKPVANKYFDPGRFDEVLSDIDQFIEGGEPAKIAELDKLVREKGAEEALLEVSSQAGSALYANMIYQKKGAKALRKWFDEESGFDINKKRDVEELVNYVGVDKELIDAAKGKNPDGTYDPEFLDKEPEGEYKVFNPKNGKNITESEAKKDLESKIDGLIKDEDKGLTPEEYYKKHGSDEELGIFTQYARDNYGGLVDPLKLIDERLKSISENKKLKDQIFKEARANTKSDFIKQDGMVNYETKDQWLREKGYDKKYYFDGPDLIDAETGEEIGATVGFNKYGSQESHIVDKINEYEKARKNQNVDEKYQDLVPGVSLKSGLKFKSKSGHKITLGEPEITIDLDGNLEGMFNYTFEKADGTKGSSKATIKNIRDMLKK